MSDFSKPIKYSLTVPEIMLLDEFTRLGKTVYEQLVSDPRTPPEAAQEAQSKLVALSYIEQKLQKQAKKSAEKKVV
jgi:hypothetical protein